MSAPAARQAVAALTGHLDALHGAMVAPVLALLVLAAVAVAALAIVAAFALALAAVVAGIVLGIRRLVHVCTTWSAARTTPT